MTVSACTGRVETSRRQRVPNAVIGAVSVAVGSL